MFKNWIKLFTNSDVEEDQEEEISFEDTLLKARQNVIFSKVLKEERKKFNILAKQCKYFTYLGDDRKCEILSIKEKFLTFCNMEKCPLNRRF